MNKNFQHLTTDRTEQFKVGTFAVVFCMLCGCTNTLDNASVPGGPASGVSERSSAHTKANVEAVEFAPWHLVGKKLGDPSVETFLVRATGTPDRENVPGYGSFVSLDSDGIELSAELDGTITTVMLFGRASDKRKAYAGPMPQSLAWEMARRDVERTIGRGTQHSFTQNTTAGHYELFATYPELGMFLNYVAKSDDDPNARLVDIRIKNAGL